MAMLDDTKTNVNLETLVEEANNLWIKATIRWKVETIQAKIAEAKWEPKPSKPTPPTTPSKVNEADLSAIFDRLDKLEKENAELKWEDQSADKKARYLWPRLFSYKMWTWIPVLTYVSKKKDSKRWFTYRNANDVYVNNQDLVLELADWSKEQVDVNEFGDSFERSDKMEALDENGNTIMLWMSPLSYTFKDVEWYCDITVLSNSIN